jgi:hypothetical protein
VFAAVFYCGGPAWSAERDAVIDNEKSLISGIGLAANLFG